MQTTLNVLSVFLATLSTYALWRSGKALPFEMQTLGGVSPPEVAFRRARKLDTRFGFALLIAVAALQVAAAMEAWKA